MASKKVCKVNLSFNTYVEGEITAGRGINYAKINNYITNMGTLPYSSCVDITKSINTLVDSCTVKFTENEEIKLFVSHGIILKQTKIFTVGKFDIENVRLCMTSHNFYNNCFTIKNELYDKFKNLLEKNKHTYDKNKLTDCFFPHSLYSNYFNNRYGATQNTNEKLFNSLELLANLYDNDWVLKSLLANNFKNLESIFSYGSNKLIINNVFPKFLNGCTVSLDCLVTLMKTNCDDRFNRYVPDNYYAVHSYNNYVNFFRHMIKTYIKNDKFTEKTIFDFFDNVYIPHNLLTKYESSKSYIKTRYDDLTKEIAELYTCFVNHINLVPTQELIDYCFSKDDSILFSVISSRDISPKIKFTQNHMSLSCKYLDIGKVTFLLNQMVRPTMDEINELVLLHNDKSIKILEVMNKFNVTMTSNSKQMIDMINNSNTKQTGDFKNILNMSDVELKEHKRKFMLKTNYSKINKNPSNEILQKLFSFDTLENIKTYISTHKLVVDLACCECAMLNPNVNVVLYVLKEYNYKPSIQHIIRVNDYVQRVYMFDTYYSDMKTSDEYKNQVLKSNTSEKPVELKSSDDKSPKPSKLTSNKSSKPVKKIATVKKPLKNNDVLCDDHSDVSTDAHENSFADELVNFDNEYDIESHDASDHEDYNSQIEEKPKKISKKVAKSTKSTKRSK